MKKAITILLAATLMLSLAACGGGNDSNNKPISGENDTPTTQGDNAITPEVTEMSKDEMLAVAEDLVGRNLYNDVNENAARASQMYLGNVYLLKGHVTAIHIGVCEIELLGINENENFNLSVYLPDDELVALNTDEMVTFVGKLTALSEYDAEFTNAYIVDKSNLMEITGVVDYSYTTDKDQTHVTEWHVHITDDNGIVYQIAPDDITSYDSSEAKSDKGVVLLMQSVTISGESIMMKDVVTVSAEITARGEKYGDTTRYAVQNVTLLK